MIRFEGLQSKEYQATYHRQHNVRMGVFVTLLLWLGMGGLIAIGLLTKDHIVVDSDFLFIIIGTLVLPMIVFLLPRKDLPTTGQVLIIDGDKISFCFHQLQYATKSRFKTFKLSRVRKVVDYGDWYFIYFRGNAIDFIGCQKDQILVGSIEEFEALFADKLVRRKQ